MIYGVLDKDGENDVGQLAGSAATGTPIGTWASFEKDYAPNIEWIQGGTTFNPNTYPALAMYLGGNKVPEMFDHNRPSAWEDVASTNTFTPAYDGFMAVSYYNSGVIIKVNGVQIDIDNSPSNANGNMTLPFKKGDVITFFNVYDGSARTIAFKVYYYKHPLFIKATPTSSDSDYEGVLNGIRTYVRNSNSYSTEEQPTGGTWIDGKPIYRKCFRRIEEGGNWDNVPIASGIDTITKVEGTAVREGVYVVNLPSVFGSSTYQISIGVNIIQNGVWTFGVGGWNISRFSNICVTIEYTKTTDSPAT